MIPADVHTLRHGYNLADLERLANGAVGAAYTRAMDYSDRYDAAWFAIVEALYMAEERPEPWRLKRAGSRAVNRLAQDHGHTWGYDRANADAGYEAMPRFLKYWELDRRARSSPEGSIVDRVALWQIWPELSGTHRAVLLAMAAHRDQEAAAAGLGKSYATVGSHLKNARREFLALWHEGETPSRLWGKADRRRGRHTAAQTLRNRRQQRARKAGLRSPTGRSARLKSAARVGSTPTGGTP
jgi:hypothetical protein